MLLTPSARRASCAESPLGVTYIRREERPVAFWACVTAYLGFGGGILLCAWLVL